jgi:hypothetical protein
MANIKPLVGQSSMQKDYLDLVHLRLPTFHVEGKQVGFESLLSELECV